MRGWSIFFGILIFASIVSVSFSHTVDLYLRVGFLLWEARLATFAVEATFLLSGWSILWYRMQKKDPGKAAYLGFSFGLFMALFSNSAYTVGLDWLFGNKAAQWILAVSVVACVGISEAIISQNLLGRKMDKSSSHSADKRSRMAGEPATSASTVNQVADQKSASQPSGRKVVNQSTSRVSRISQPSATVNRLINQPNRPVAEKGVEADQLAVSQLAETASQPIDQPAKSASHQPVNQSNQPGESTSSSSTDRSISVVDQPAESTSQTINHQSDLADQRKQADQPADQSTNQPADQPSATKRSNVVDMAVRQAADQKAIETAEKYYKETGELPSRRKLAKMADTTPYRASKAINYLKKKYNLSQTKTANGR